MTKLKKVIIGIFIFLVASVLLLQIDDELSFEAKAILGSVDWQTPSDSYLYLIGIGAELGSAPAEVGSQVLSDYNEAALNYADTKELYFRNDKEKIELPEHEAFCSARVPECILSLFSNQEGLLESEAMAALKERYLMFMSMRGYRTLTKPSVFEPMPSYQYLVKGNRLFSLSSIELAEGGEPEIALRMLYQLIDMQKKHISETDNLIGRMIAYVMLNETIDVTSLLIQKYAVTGAKIQLMSVDELSMEKPINREFAFVHSGVNDLYMNGDAVETYWPGWALRVVYKPNMMMNAVVPVYQNAKDNSRLTLPSFALMASDGVELTLKSSWVRNSVGSILNQVARIDLNPYIARGFDLNAKISLFNAIVNEPIIPDTLLSIDNPYYPGQHRTPAMSEDKARVCFDGPYEDPRNFRCITVLNSNEMP